ncbi:hypothetical protein ANANG_G00228640 [Anguilla anguilla]|uniref:Uncharacterized protein n=1 Tax=Anguilla anguilla TaxID=7936 RepID=A0A9D3RQD7_ANGAN|nr:hypothetical protein ANANG_G00228640 [Anguilla anguilla]
MQPHTAEVARLYQTEFVRSARAVGALWAICTLCFAIIEAGTLGLFEVCLESDWPVPECRGLRTLTPLPAFQSPAVLVCISLAMVWVSVGCLCLFRFCNAATVYKICAWLQLTAGFCLALACLLPGNCSVHWAFVLAMLGVLDAAILATLAFVLGNRQDALLPEDGKDVTGLLLAA